jgi:hypothetical protein
VSDEARRAAALATMLDRFPAVANRVREVYGLRLPRHLAVFAALWHSASAAERLGLDDLMLRPWGITDYFGDDGLHLVGRDGLDERLHCRYRRDPAEFVTVVSGGSDGEHWGLWYDDPAELPTFIAYNWARDSAETETDFARTVIIQLRMRITDVMRDYAGKPAEIARLTETLGPLESALDWFGSADADALAADGEPRWAGKPRHWCGGTLFPALPSGSGNPRFAQSYERLDDFRSGSPRGGEWIAEAARELEAGQPAFALAVGGELHWLDRDEYRAASHQLLAGAYRALGRDALAAIVEVHIAHRDLRSVDVLVRDQSPPVES